MRIFYLSTDFKPRTGGIAEMSYRIARELASRRHEVLVCTNRVDEDDPALQREPFMLRRAFDPRPVGSMRSVTGSTRAILWARSALRRMRQSATEFQPDIVLLGNYNSVWGGLSADANGWPYVQCLYGEELAAQLHTRVPGRAAKMRGILRSASWIFCVSHHSASLLTQLLGAPHEAVSVTGCGFPIEEIVDGDHRAEARRALRWDDAPTILTVARVVRRKGIDTTIRALPGILKAVPDCRYVVVGDGCDRGALEQLVMELGLMDRVEFLGQVSETVRRSVYLASDLYVMPSYPGDEGEVEGFGISFLEANAHGLTAIGSSAGGIPDAIEDGVNGLLVPPKDPQRVATAVTYLLCHPEVRTAMAEAGRRRIRERYNWPMICDVIEDGLERSLEKDGTGR